MSKEIKTCTWKILRGPIQTILVIMGIVSLPNLSILNSLNDVSLKYTSVIQNELKIPLQIMTKIIT